MQTISNISFGSKYSSLVQPIREPILAKNTEPQNFIRPQVSSGQMIMALQAQMLTETSTSALNKLSQGIDAGKTSEWSYKTKPEGGEIYSCKLNGKEYSLESTRTDETFKKDGKEYYKMAFKLNAKMAGDEPKSYDITGNDFVKVAEKAEKVAFPIIEKQYGLGKGLESSNLLVDYAEKTINGDIKWEVIDANVGFGDGFSIKADGAIETKMPDGTKVKIIEIVTNQIFSITRESYIGLEKEGLPPQLIKVGSDKENDAYVLLGTAFQILQKEDELYAALEELKGHRGELKNQIDEFKKPPVPKN